MVQAGIWMVCIPVNDLLTIASWLQREIWRFDDYVELSICVLDSIDAISNILMQFL